MNSVQAARTRKTIFWRDHRDLFLDQLEQDLDRFLAYCQKKGIQPCVRLNGTSDIPFENYLDMSGRYSAIQFYDYTKTVNRINKPLPKNYHLTLSYSEASERYADMVLNAMRNNTGQTMAVVFRDKDCIPETFKGYPVIDGDKDDLRFLDKRGTVVALYAKGQAKHDQSGFVIN